MVLAQEAITIERGVRRCARVRGFEEAEDRVNRRKRRHRSERE
jgi:hypothetical protein